MNKELFSTNRLHKNIRRIIEDRYFNAQIQDHSNDRNNGLTSVNFEEK